MLTVLRVSVRRQLWRTVRGAGSLLVPEAANHSGWQSGETGRSCTVDPNREEEFVFVDWTDPEDLSSSPEQQQKKVSPEQQQKKVSPEQQQKKVSPEQQQKKVSPEQQQKVSPEQQQQMKVSPEQQIRALEHQLQVLRTVGFQETKPKSLIQFHDVDFPLDSSLMVSKRKKKVKKSEHKIYGSPDPSEPVSTTCCSGCGVVLHCSAAHLPGYLPSEKLKVLVLEERLRGATCQRCHLLTHHHRALSVHMSQDQYRDVVQQVRSKSGLVLLVVDLFDVPDSIVPDLPDLVGTNKNVVVLGNKIDLLPADAPNYLQRIKRQLSRYCRDAGLADQVTDVHLISAKTGFGVEALISSLQRSWRYKGDVYLVGSANAGKSTLFNTLLQSDFCKSTASELVHRATISPWPGTTLNLLRFPIVNPTPLRMLRRHRRLGAESQQTESELLAEERRQLHDLSRHGHLVGRVGRTFTAGGGVRRQAVHFDPDSLAFGENEDGEMTTTIGQSDSTEPFTYNELKDANWLFDTPGVMKERDVLSLLTEQEVRSVVPAHAVVPRTFVLKPNSSLFVGALARIDFLEGPGSCWFSVMASSRVPVHVTSLEKADVVYKKHGGGMLLGVPTGGVERMKAFPALTSQEVRLEGRGHLEAAADIKLSSAGWVAVTAAAAGEPLLLRVHGPEAAGFSVRTPPLLPHVVALKGARVRRSATYKPPNMVGLLGGGLSEEGARSLQLLKKRRK